MIKYGDVDVKKDEVLIVSGEYRGQKGIVKEGGRAGTLRVELVNGRTIDIDQTACEVAKR
jgi:hypothetical protein